VKKQPYITKTAKLKEKNEKDVADYKSKGKFDGTRSPAKVAWKNVEEEEPHEQNPNSNNKNNRKQQLFFLNIS
jgi:high mobility group protein B3